MQSHRVSVRTSGQSLVTSQQRVLSRPAVLACGSQSTRVLSPVPGLFRASRFHSALHNSHGRALTRMRVVEEPFTIVETVTETQTAKEYKPFVWTKVWYPVAVVDELDPTRPTQITLLGEDYVLWRDGAGAWRAFADKCPHRLAPLSEGRVESDGTLLCAYHAWRFDGAGKCTAIPQAKDKDQELKARSNPRACATAYPTRTEQGLVWLWPEACAMAELEASSHPIRHIVETLEEGDHVMKPGWRSQELPYGLDYFFENVVDPAHVVVSHHNIVGNRYTGPKFVDLRPVDPMTRENGFSYMQPSNRVGLVGKTSFFPPNLVRVDTISPDGARTIISLYASPTKPGHCKHIGRQVFVKGTSGKWPKGLSPMTGNDLPVWFKHILAPLFLHQDAIFLHFQEKIVNQSPHRNQGTFDKYFTPTASDKMVLALRKWFERYSPQGIPFKGAYEGKPLPPAERDPNKLFDTWTAHTKNCRICKTALENIRKVQVAAWAVCAVALIQGAIASAASASAKAAALAAAGMAAGAAATSASFSLPPLAAVAWAALALLALGAGIGLGKLISLFYVVPFNHQDNN